MPHGFDFNAEVSAKLLLGTRTAWQAHQPWQPLGWHWAQVAVSVGHWCVGTMTEKYPGEAGELFSCSEK